MLYNIKIDGSTARDSIIAYLKEKRAQETFTVIDVGGSINGWSREVIDAIVDFNEPEQIQDILYFKCDITHPESWKPIFDYVSIYGKFDFSICTHTLEDIMNPGFVCEQLSKISKQGYIAVPSKYMELAKIAGPYRGYIHHRWIFVVRNGEFIAYPKLNFIEYLQCLDTIASPNIDTSDLSFYWKDDIKVTYLNDNYMGPSNNDVIHYFITLCEKDDYE